MKSTKEMKEAKETKATKVDAIKDCSHRLKAVRDAMEVVGGKWKIPIITCLCFRAMRYSDLLREIPGISGKMLSRELKELETNQLIERRVEDTHPVTVTYKMTKHGASLADVVMVISDWGLVHRKKIMGK